MLLHCLHFSKCSCSFLAKKLNNCGSEIKWNIKRFVFSRIILVKLKTFLEELVGWRRNIQPDGTMHNGITAWQYSIQIVACQGLKTSPRFHPLSLSLFMTILCRACPYHRDHILHLERANMHWWDICFLNISWRARWMAPQHSAKWHYA